MLKPVHVIYMRYNYPRLQKRFKTITRFFFANFCAEIAFPSCVKRFSPASEIYLLIKSLLVGSKHFVLSVLLNPLLKPIQRCFYFCIDDLLQFFNYNVETFCIYTKIFPSLFKFRPFWNSFFLLLTSIHTTPLTAILFFHYSLISSSIRRCFVLSASPFHPFRYNSKGSLDKNICLLLRFFILIWLSKIFALFVNRFSRNLLTFLKSHTNSPPSVLRDPKFCLLLIAVHYFSSHLNSVIIHSIILLQTIIHIFHYKSFVSNTSKFTRYSSFIDIRSHFVNHASFRIDLNWLHTHCSGFETPS